MKMEELLLLKEYPFALSVKLNGDTQRSLFLPRRDCLSFFEGSSERKEFSLLRSKFCSIIKVGLTFGRISTNMKF